MVSRTSQWREDSCLTSSFTMASPKHCTCTQRASRRHRLNLYTLPFWPHNSFSVESERPVLLSGELA